MSIPLKVKQFLSDLQTMRWEYGLSNTDTWEINFANDIEKLKIEKKHYPVLLLSLPHTDLLEAYLLIKKGLAHAEEPEFPLVKNSQKHIIAYSLKGLA